MSTSRLRGRGRRGLLTPRVAVCTFAGSLVVGGLLVGPAAQRAAMAKAAWETTRNARPAPPPPDIRPVVDAVPDHAGEPTEFLALVSRTAKGAGCRLVGWDNLPTPAGDPRATVMPARVRAETLGSWDATVAFIRRLDSTNRRVHWVRCELTRSAPGSRVLRGVWEIERYRIRIDTETASPSKTSNPPPTPAVEPSR